MKRNLLYVSIAVTAWSTLSPITKLLLNNGFPNMEALFLPSFIAFITMIPITFCTSAKSKFQQYQPKDYAGMCGLGFLGTFLYYLLYYKGLAQLKAQEACILNYLWPVMLVMFSCILMHEKLTIMKIVALLFSFSGVVVLCMSGNMMQVEKIVGIVSCIAAAACYGLFCVLNKKEGYNQQITMMLMWLVTAVCSLIVGLLTETWRMPTVAEWIGFLWLGVAADALAYLLWALALQNSDGTAFIANLAYLTPFLSVYLSSVLLHEKIELKAILALLLIVSGILCQVFFDNRKLHKRKSD